MNHDPKIQRLKIGMIPFWNLAPFRQELLRDRNLNIDMKVGSPTFVNKCLQDGEIHLAPSSSICLNYPGFEMALPLGIASDGFVRSVYVGLQAEHLPLLEILSARLPLLKNIFKSAQSGFDFNARYIAQHIKEAVQDMPTLPLNECPPLKFPNSSASSVMLSKILYFLWFGHDAYKFMSARNFAPLSGGQKAIELLIGDEALIRQNSYAKTIDLGQFWKDLSGLPFVFAVWQSKGLCLNGWRRKILEVGELAEKKMRVEPTDYLPVLPPLDDSGSPIPLIDYWKEIKYKLGPEEFRGLLVFLCLSRKLSEQALDHEIAVKLLRWQEACQPSAT